MLLRLFLLFTVTPAIELAVLIEIGRHIGAGSTIALLLLSGVLGAALARHEGLRTLRRIRGDLAAGRMPTDSLVDGMLILAAGLLLVSPGVLTDGLGLCLLIPPVRRLAREALKRRFAARIVVTGRAGDVPFARDDFIDVEARPVDDEP